MNILVVDDNEQNQNLFIKLLKGHSVKTAENGVEALERARMSWPDMIIIDSHMSEMDGFLLCKTLKNDKNLQNIPVLFCNAKYTDEKSLEEFVQMETYTKQEIQKHKEKTLDLKRSEEKLRIILDNTNDMVVHVNKYGRILDINKKVEEIMGYKQYEIVGKNFVELGVIQPKNIPKIIMLFKDAIKSGISVDIIELELKNKSGKIIYVEAGTQLIKKEGKIEGAVSILRDITKRKQVEEKLKEYHDHLEELVEMRTAEVRKVNEQLQQEISERKLIEKALRYSEEKTRALLNASTDSIVLIDSAGMILAINKVHANNLGQDEENLIGKYIYNFFPTDVAELIKAKAKEVFSIKKPIRFLENRGERTYDTYDYPVFSIEGKVSEIAVYTRDITKRKAAEDQIKAALAEKEVLLQEIHHRVKNNLQVISSMLNLQARVTEDKATIDILFESQNRINTMALIHTQLYESKNLSKINMKIFINKLMTQLLHTYSVLGDRIIHTISVVDYPFPISIAIPIGLIINELLSNTIKYAFNKGKEGKIELDLSISKDGKVNLMVSDDGVGLPEGFDINGTRTLGLRLVKILVENQLDGTLEVISKEGTTFNIKFDMKDDVDGKRQND